MLDRVTALVHRGHDEILSPRHCALRSIDEPLLNSAPLRRVACLRGGIERPDVEFANSPLPSREFCFRLQPAVLLIDYAVVLRAEALLQPTSASGRHRGRDCCYYDNDNDDDDQGRHGYLRSSGSGRFPPSTAWDGKPQTELPFTDGGASGSGTH